MKRYITIIVLSVLASVFFNATNIKEQPKLDGTLIQQSPKKTSFFRVA
jgi:hypothetical protein